MTSTNKKGRISAATLPAPAPNPVAMMRKDVPTMVQETTHPDAESIADERCGRPECSSFQRHPADTRHFIPLSKGGVSLRADGDGPWSVRVEARILSGPQVASDLGSEIRRAASMLEYFARPAHDRIAGTIRVCLMEFGSPGNSAVMLREVLEVSKSRARNLYAGREAYTADELEVLAVYFGFSGPAALFGYNPRPPVDRRTWLLDRAAAETAARQAGEDRLVTYREERAA